MTNHTDSLEVEFSRKHTFSIGRISLRELIDDKTNVGRKDCKVPGPGFLGNHFPSVLRSFSVATFMRCPPRVQIRALDLCSLRAGSQTVGARVSPGFVWPPARGIRRWYGG